MLVEEMTLSVGTGEQPSLLVYPNPVHHSEG